MCVYVYILYICLTQRLELMVNLMYLFLYCSWMPSTMTRSSLRGPTTRWALHWLLGPSYLPMLLHPDDCNAYPSPPSIRTKVASCDPVAVSAFS